MSDESAGAVSTDPVKTGSVVVLKSGGPPMVVESMKGEICTCVWFLLTMRREERFNVTSLQAITLKKLRVTVTG